LSRSLETVSNTLDNFVGTGRFAVEISSI